MQTATKTFDCVEMKHKAAERIRRATQGMSVAEELAFWARGTRQLLQRKKALQAVPSARHAARERA